MLWREDTVFLRLHHPGLLSGHLGAPHPGDFCKNAVSSSPVAGSPAGSTCPPHLSPANSSRGCLPVPAPRLELTPAPRPAWPLIRPRRPSGPAVDPLPFTPPRRPHTRQNGLDLQPAAGRGARCASVFPFPTGRPGQCLCRPRRGGGRAPGRTGGGGLGPCGFLRDLRWVPQGSGPPRRAHLPGPCPRGSGRTPPRTCGSARARVRRTRPHLAGAARRPHRAGRRGS